MITALKVYIREFETWVISVWYIRDKRYTKNPVTNTKQYIVCTSTYTINIYIHIVPKKEKASPKCIILLLCSLQPVYQFKDYAQHITANHGVNKQPFLQTTDSNQPCKLEERKQSTAPSKPRQYLPVALIFVYFIGPNILYWQKL